MSSRTAAGDALVFGAHQAAKEGIKAIRPEVQVGITLPLHDIQALPGGESYAEKAWDEEFRYYLPFIQGDDWMIEFYPEALEHVIRKGNLIVTENGVATSGDTRRAAFIRSALRGVENCLIAVNRATPARTPKESLRCLGSVIQVSAYAP